MSQGSGWAVDIDQTTEECGQVHVAVGSVQLGATFMST